MTCVCVCASGKYCVVWLLHVVAFRTYLGGLVDIRYGLIYASYAYLGVCIKKSAPHDAKDLRAPINMHARAAQSC